MKKLNQLWKSIFGRSKPTVHPAIVEQVHQLRPDYEMIRFSVWLHFRLGNTSSRYLLDYNAEYDYIMDGLRSEGWDVELQVLDGGTMSYSIRKSANVISQPSN